MIAWVSIISILFFVISIFLWVYDHEGEKIPEKITVSFIGLTAILVIISLLFIAPPHVFSHAEVQILIVLFFLVVFTFLTLAEQEKLRVILFGAALSVMLMIIFLNQLLPLESLLSLTHEQLENLTAEQLSEAVNRKLPLTLEQLVEIAETPALFFE